MKEEKVWGTAHHVFCSETCAVSVLETKKGGFSSNHYHRDRVNRFIVQSGQIDIVHECGPTVHLGPGDTYDVEPGIVHRFEVIEPGVVVEVYYAAPVRLDDIIRLDTGGLRA